MPNTQPLLPSHAACYFYIMDLPASPSGKTPAESTCRDLSGLRSL